MKYQAVLFDLDGTLLDTLQDLAYSVNTSLGYLGFPSHTTEAFKYFIGDGREEMGRRSLPAANRDPATLSKLVENINREYTRHWVDNTRPYAGVADLLDALTHNGTRMAVLSNKPHDFTESMISRLLSSWHFEVVAGAMTGVPIKPDPTAALMIAQKMNIPAAGFLYLGDSDIDMRTAVAAGMYPVGAVWGFRTEDELKVAGAKTLIRHPIELLHLFDS
jgi:phosphoglycolate phosphatase